MSLDADAQATLLAMADDIWPEGTEVSPEAEDRACQIWASAAKVGAS